jgi:hypothetical protein
VAGENIEFLILCYQALGDSRVLDAIRRGMNAFIVTQQGPPQPAWALQYDHELKPAGARTYEPKALVTHTTARNLELLIRFYRLTGETRFLARVPEALDWLEAVKAPPDVAPKGRTHPTFIEVGTNKPLYVHREGSNVVNGRYYFDYSPKKTIGHYSAFRQIDVAGLRTLYEQAKAGPAELVARDSPLTPGTGVLPLPKFFAVEKAADASVAALVDSLGERGYWEAPLGMNSHPYRGDGSAAVTPGDFSQTHVGDDRDTSPYPDDKIRGISTAAYIHNMSALIRFLESGS